MVVALPSRTRQNLVSSYQRVRPGRASQAHVDVNVVTVQRLAGSESDPGLLGRLRDDCRRAQNPCRAYGPILNSKIPCSPDPSLSTRNLKTRATVTRAVTVTEAWPRTRSLMSESLAGDPGRSN